MSSVRVRAAVVGLVALVTSGELCGVGPSAWSLTASRAASDHSSTDVANTSMLDGVACAASGCVAVGESDAADGTSTGAVVPITGGTPGQVQTVPTTVHLFGVACTAGGTCLAVGAAKDAQGDELGALLPVTIGAGGNVTPGSATTVASVTELGRVACLSADHCLAVDSVANPPLVVAVVNGSAGSPVAVPDHGSNPAVACSPMSCWLTADASRPGGAMYSVEASTGALRETSTISTVLPDSLSCPASDRCVVGAEVAGFQQPYAAVYSATAGKVSGKYRIDASAGPVAGIACESTALCVGLAPGATPILRGGEAFGNVATSHPVYRAVTYAGNHAYVSVGYDVTASGRLGAVTMTSLPPPTSTKLSITAPKYVKKDRRFIITARLTDSSTGRGIDGQPIQFAYRPLTRSGRPKGAWATGGTLTITTHRYDGRAGVARLRASDDRPLEWRAEYPQQSLRYWPSVSAAVKVRLR